MGFIYLTSVSAREQVASRKKAGQSGWGAAATIILGMKAEKIGRVLGIGLRVAGKMAGEKLAGGAQAAGAQTAGGAAAGQHQQTGQVGLAGQKGQTGQIEQNEQAAAGAAAGGQAGSQADARAKGQAAGRTAKGVARGVGGFLRPFRRVGGILWLEMTGAFFFLFVLYFAQALWRMREGWAQGENRPKFVVFAAMLVGFLYLSVSSFWRARRR